jgi:ppGpp synthetase/RelA/SpoT-type nucleotidyltranferase
MNELEIKLEYDKRLPNLERAKENSVRAIEYFLSEGNISFFSVTGRVKDFKSFAEKIERKEYSNPFDDNEDFCGIRVIVYYQDDIPKVQEIINREFDVINNSNKSEELAINELGYRSSHFVVLIKKEWMSAPNYRGLNDIKIEIQVRTILMHSWAEIEHKLAYKKKSQIPNEIYRELLLLSGNFETADGNFQRIKNAIDSYRDNIKLSVANNETLTTSIKLNYDSLLALLDHYLSDYPKSRANTINLLERLLRQSLTFDDVKIFLDKITQHASRLNDAVFPKKNLRLTQPTILSYAIDIYSRYDPDIMYTEARRQIVNQFRGELLKL